MERTVSSAYFEENILPYILRYGADALAVVSALAIVLRKINKARKTFEVARDSLKDASETAKNSLQTVKDSLIEAKVLTDTEKETSSKKDAKLLAQNEEIANLKTDLKGVQSELTKLIEVCKIAFLNNKDLVSNGYSAKIAKIIGKEVNGEIEIEREETIDGTDAA
jgi:DNA repair protein RadC